MDIQASTDAGVALDPKRLRYLTENFVALQGLSVVPLGLVLAIWEITEFLTKPRLWMFLLWLLASVTAFDFMAIRGPRYYRSRFGLVQQTPGTAFNPSARQAVFVCLAFFVIMMVGDVTDHLIHAPADALSLWAWSGGTIFLAMFHRHFRLLHGVGSSRLNYLLPLWFSYPLITLYPLLTPVHARYLIFWNAMHAGYIGIAIVVIGICDHIMLVRLMPKSAGEAPRE